MRILLLAALLCLSGFSSAQYISWAHNFGGSNNEEFYSVQNTSDGGYILAGQTYSTEDGNGNAWLVKVDSDGNEQWSSMYGGADDAGARAVVESSDGGYVFAGHTTSTYTGNSDFWLVKVDSDGNVDWEQTYGGSDYDEAYSLVQTSDGGYALAGETDSYGAGSGDFWLVKTDSDGNEEWDQTYGGSDYEGARGMKQAPDDGYILTGETYSYGNGDADYWLVKTDSDGNQVWAQSYGGDYYDTSDSVQNTTDGGYIIAGHSYSYGENGDGSDSDAWLVKVDSDGNEDWANSYGDSQYDRADAVQETPDGGYVFAGETDSFGNGDGDFWLVKVDPDGNEISDYTYGGTDYERADALAQTPDGQYVMAGQAYSYGINGDGWAVKTSDSDNSPPTTTASAGTYRFGSWTRQDVEVALDCTDDFGSGSGCDSTFYCEEIDGNCIENTYGGTPITISATTVMRFYSVDNAGNGENEHSVEINIDKEAPSLDFTLPTPANNSFQNSSSAYVNFSVTDISPVSAFMNFNGSLTFLDYGKSLAGYWTFDNVSGTIRDYSPNGNDCTNMTRLPAQVPGKLGNASNFSGNWISCGTSDSLKVEHKGEFTLEAWIRTNSNAADQMIMNDGGQDYYGFFFLVNRFGGHNLDLANAGQADHIVDYTFAPGTWYHVAAVQHLAPGTPGSIEYFVNGVSIGSVDGGAEGYYSSSGMQFVIGGGYMNPFNGSMDEVMVWNRALAPQEINATYNAKRYLFDFLRPAAPLASGSPVGDWSFDDVNGDVVHDSSPSGNDATSNGATVSSGVSGNAMNFDGFSYLEVPADSSLDMGGKSVTICLWVKCNSTYGDERMLVEHDVWGNPGTYQLTSYDDHTLAFNFPSSENTPSANFNFCDGNWHYVVGMLDTDAQVAQVYVDGALMDSEPDHANIDSSEAPLYIGSRGGTDIFFEGSLDEVQVWDRAFSSEEVNASYMANRYKFGHNYANLSSGTYSFTAYSLDAAGNFNSSETRTFTVTSVLPSLAINSPPGNSTLNVSPITLNWTPYNFTSNPVCNLTRNGTRIYSATCTVNSSCVSINATPDGFYSWNVSCSAGGQGVLSDTRNFTVDSTAPAISIQSPANSTYPNSSVSLNFISGDALTGVNSCKYSLDGGANVSGCGNSTISLSDGSHTVAVYSTDNAGNTGSAGVSFTISPPAPPSNSSAVSVVKMTLKNHVISAIFLEKIELDGYTANLTPVNFGPGATKTITFNISAAICSHTGQVVEFKSVRIHYKQGGIDDLVESSDIGLVMRCS